MSKILDLIFKLDVMSNGIETVNKAAQAFNTVTQAANKLRQSAGQTGEYIRLQQAVRQNQETMLAMRSSAAQTGQQLQASKLHVQ